MKLNLSYNFLLFIKKNYQNLAFAPMYHFLKSYKFVKSPSKNFFVNFKKLLQEMVLTDFTREIIFVLCNDFKCLIFIIFL